ncbi:MAG: hypothetical protein K8S54_15800 [Spirochaetia bacterium]|nr:hypothetical protein [Spirochaetia bacterium]
MGAVEDCLPPVLHRNRDRIREALEAALGTLAPELVTSFESNLKTAGAGSTTRWLFQMICLHAGFASVNLAMGNVAIFSYGIQTAWDDLPGKTWGKIERDFLVGDIILTFTGFLPLPVKDLAEAALDSTLLVHAENVFLNSQGLREKNLQNVFFNIERDTRPILEEILNTGVPVTLTHFLFQDLRVYFSLSGEYRSQEIMDSIQAVISENLKKSDRIFRISPLSYIVISPGADSKQIQSRFKSIYIQIKSLVLDYDLRLCTVNQLPIRFTQIWSELL